MYNVIVDGTYECMGERVCGCVHVCVCMCVCVCMRACLFVCVSRSWLCAVIN